MLVELQPSDSRPLYRQIADEIERNIATGILRSGDALPAVRLLAADLRVNPNTVQQAYRYLAQQGTVTMRRGRGTFVSGAPRAPRGRASARQIAERALRDAFRHGVSAEDVVSAIRELAGRR